MTWIIDDLYNLIVQILAYLGDVYTEITHLPDIIGQMISDVATLITYPITGYASMIITIATDMITHITGPIGGMIQIQMGAFTIINAILGNLLPLTWVSLILTGVTIIVCIRIYHFIKDIEILGNKV